MSNSPLIPKPPKLRPWKCGECGYNDNIDDFCTNCGRTRLGEPGQVPTKKPHRPQLRGK